MIVALAAMVRVAFAGDPPRGGEAPGFGEDFVTPEEAKKLELEKKRNAQPVLTVEPSGIEDTFREGEAREFTLTVRNAGGRTLDWSVSSAPEWLRPSSRSGSLGYEGGEKLTLTFSPPAGSGVGAAGGEKVRSSGLFDGELVLTAAGAAKSPLKVSVILDVTPKPKPTPGDTAPVAVTPAVTKEDKEETPEPPGPLEDLPEAPEAPGAEGKGTFGVRAGVFLPSTGDDADYGANFALGLYYRPKEDDGAKLSYEVALGLGGSEEEGPYESRPLTGDFNLLFNLGELAGNAKGYLVSGLGGIMEPVEDTSSGEGYTNYAGALNVGGGLAFGGGKYDARLTYGILLGSENVTGQTALSFGVGF